MKSVARQLHAKPHDSVFDFRSKLIHSFYQHRPVGFLLMINRIQQHIEDSL